MNYIFLGFTLIGSFMNFVTVKAEMLPGEEKSTSNLFVEKKLPDEATIVEQHKKELDIYKAALEKVRAYEQELKKLKEKNKLHHGFVFDDIEKKLKNDILTAQKKANSMRTQLRDSLVKAGLTRDRANTILDSL